MLGFDPIQVAVTAEKTSDGYKVSVKHEDITSERVLDARAFERFREAIGDESGGAEAPELIGQHFSGPVSQKVLQDFGFSEFYRAA